MTDTVIGELDGWDFSDASRRGVSNISLRKRTF